MCIDKDNKKDQLRKDIIRCNFIWSRINNKKK